MFPARRMNLPGKKEKKKETNRIQQVGGRVISFVPHLLARMYIKACPKEEKNNLNCRFVVTRIKVLTEIDPFQLRKTSGMHLSSKCRLPKYT